MAKITIEELSGSLKEYLNGLGLTEAQVQELIDKFEDEKIGDISQLSTEEKGSLVGAINELFQDVDSGKTIIADAIDDINISKDSTFAAMGEAIEGIHADREEDRQKLIDILVGSNMELSGNESMDTLLDLIDMSNLDLSKVVQVACGYNCTFILYDDGRLYSCGYNGYGALGINDGAKDVFTQVTENINNDVKQVSCGTGFTYILKNDGSLWSCGFNGEGQLGIGSADTSNHNTFNQVTTNINNDVKQIDCGNNYTFIIKNDGSLWACGNNEYGKLGLGDTTNRNTFIQVTNNINNDIKEVIGGGYHIFIIKNDGSVWSCGYNRYGQLGLGDTTDRNTFTQVTTNINNDVKQIDCGNQHSMVLKNDGSVWGCGFNNKGHLGLNNTDSKTTFTQVTTNINNDVKQISCGKDHTFILKNDGSLWACGYNDTYGQLGLNVVGSNTNKYTFTQVTTNVNNDVKEVIGGDNHSFIIKNDSSLWACGCNNNGQLGLGDKTNRNAFTVVNQTEALKTQVTSLQAEATANRGNLATVLTDEDVELTGEETLADLIVKTDEEFNDKNNEMSNGKELIANAIGDSSITVDSTFSAMSDKITEIIESSCDVNSVKQGIVDALARAGSKASTDEDLDSLLTKVASCKRFAYVTTSGSGIEKLSDTLTLTNSTQYGENYKVSGEITVRDDLNYDIDSANLIPGSGGTWLNSGQISAGVYGEVIRNEEVIYTTSKINVDAVRVADYTLNIPIPLYPGDKVRCYAWRSNAERAWPWVFYVGAQLVQKNNI